MKRFRLFPLVIMTAFLITSCNRLDRKYNRDDYSENIAALKKSGKLSEDDGKLLNAYKMVKERKGEKLENMTYREMIKEAKQKTLDQYTREYIEASDKILRKLDMDIALTNFIFKRRYTREDYIEFSLALQNRSGKDIRSVEGSLITAYDRHDQKIGELKINFDGIKKDETFEKSFNFYYPQIKSECKEFQIESSNQVHFYYEIKKIVFTDGSSME